MDNNILKDDLIEHYLAEQDLKERDRILMNLFENDIMRYDWLISTLAERDKGEHERVVHNFNKDDLPENGFPRTDYYKSEKTRKELIAKILLKYSNIQLKGNPRSLHEVHELIIKYNKTFSSLYPQHYYRNLYHKDFVFDNEINEVIAFNINGMIELSKVNDPNAIFLYLDELPNRIWKKYNPKSQVPSGMPIEDIIKHYDIYKIAANEVYGYSYEGQECPCSEWRKEAIGAQFFQGSNRLKCFECDQEYFNYLLNMIVLEKNIEEISGLEILIKSFSSTITRYTIGFGKVLFSIDSRPVYNSQNSFPKIFNGLLSNLLIEYLSDPDFERGRIKKCPYCHMFYLAKNLKRTYCYDSKKCHRAFMAEQKRKQRINEPEIYS